MIHFQKKHKVLNKKGVTMIDGANGYSVRSKSEIKIARQLEIIEGILKQNKMLITEEAGLQKIITLLNLMNLFVQGNICFVSQISFDSSIAKICHNMPTNIKDVSYGEVMDIMEAFLVGQTSKLAAFQTYRKQFGKHE